MKEGGTEPDYVSIIAWIPVVGVVFLVVFVMAMWKLVFGEFRRV